MESTGSIAQDCLLAGFLKTCYEGVNKLLKVTDLTVETCKSFEPQALEAAYEKVKDKNSKLLRLYSIHKVINDKIFGIIPKRIFMKKEDRRFYDNNWPYMGGVIEYKVGVPDYTRQLGSVVVPILAKTENYPEEWRETDTITKTAKSAQVEYEDYDSYSEQLIPDHVIEDIKIAMHIGLVNIKIAYVKIVDTIVRDPIVIGYIPKDVAQGQLQSVRKMFMITRFGLNKEEDKQLADCSSKTCVRS